MRKTYQFRIYPGRKQEVVLNRTLSTCRHLYNEKPAERKKQSELNRLKTKTGIDVGLIDLLTLSNGEQIKPPKFLRESEDKLTQEQKRLSRKKKRSEKRNKQRIIVAKVHRKIRNQRKDFTHKTSQYLRRDVKKLIQ
jgi:putative transposase